MVKWLLWKFYFSRFVAFSFSLPPRIPGVRYLPQSEFDASRQPESSVTMKNKPVITALFLLRSPWKAERPVASHFRVMIMGLPFDSLKNELSFDSTSATDAICTI